ncbi:MAG: cytochrome c-type biogenesis protein CcmH [Alphaproteobacteria bacterium]|nr:cytochrome c-type biogenesis protein CcmH [Alphaproteobacteria bacterium]
MKNLFKLLLFLICLSCPKNGFSNDALSVETEALEIADRLRCLVCSDENIETAQDETAKDMRFFIRRHLTDGKTQDLVVHLLLSQYGDMISLEDAPVPTAQNEEAFTLVSFTLCFASMALYIYRRARHFKA